MTVKFSLHIEKNGAIVNIKEALWKAWVLAGDDGNIHAQGLLDFLIYLCPLLEILNMKCCFRTDAWYGLKEVQRGLKNLFRSAEALEQVLDPNVSKSLDKFQGQPVF
jgi:hypothetical protein